MGQRILRVGGDRLLQKVSCPQSVIQPQLGQPLGVVPRGLGARRQRRPNSAGVGRREFSRPELLADTQAGLGNELEEFCLGTGLRHRGNRLARHRVLDP